jgi:hypothetical protein
MYNNLGFRARGWGTMFGGSTIAIGEGDTIVILYEDENGQKQSAAFAKCLGAALEMELLQAIAEDEQDSEQTRSGPP